MVDAAIITGILSAHYYALTPPVVVRVMVNRTTMGGHGYGSGIDRNRGFFNSIETDGVLTWCENVFDDETEPSAAHFRQLVYGKVVGGKDGKGGMS